jgi:tetrapyrrole methylase family protein / MazG family protein
LEKLIENNKQNLLEELKTLIATLRGKEGCPWDKKQTAQSITIYLIEEVYELVDAIQSKDSNSVLEELGDVLFQVFFLSHLFNEAGYFDLNEVIITNIKKMKRRHPHVFGNETIKSAEQVKFRWQEIKRQEKKNNSKENSLLNSIPHGLPALLRAYRISERAAGIGFDWDNIEEVMEQVKEEWNEFIGEIREQKGVEKKKDNVAMEFGDILFSLVNIARFAKIHPETALLASIQKFEQRFKFMEKTARLNGQKLEALSRNEWDNLWQKAKRAV